MFCISAQPGNPEAWEQRADTVEEAGTTAPVVEAVAGRWLTPGFQAEHPDVLRELQDLLAASPPGGPRRVVPDARAARPAPRARALRAPALVVHGSADKAIMPDHGERIAAGIPGARFVLPEATAHIPMAERPDAVAALILEHLEAPA